MKDLKNHFNIHLSVRIPVIVCSLFIVLSEAAFLFGFFTDYYYEFKPCVSIAMYINAGATFVLLVAIVMLSLGMVRLPRHLYLTSAILYAPAAVVGAGDSHFDWRVLIFLGGIVLLMRIVIIERVALFLETLFASLKTKFVSLFTPKKDKHLKPSYPPLVYFLGFANLALGLLFIWVEGYVIGIPLTIFAVVFLLVHRNTVYIAFCIIYGIGVVFSSFLLLRSFDTGIFLAVIIRATLLCCLVSYYPYLFGAKVNVSIAEKLLKKALKAEYNGNYEGALNIYKKVISDFPDTVAAEDAQNCLEILQKEGYSGGS